MGLLVMNAKILKDSFVKYRFWFKEYLILINC